MGIVSWITEKWITAWQEKPEAIIALVALVFIGMILELFGEPVLRWWHNWKRR